MKFSFEKHEGTRSGLSFQRGEPAQGLFQLLASNDLDRLRQLDPFSGSFRFLGPTRINFRNEHGIQVKACVLVHALNLFLVHFAGYARFLIGLDHGCAGWSESADHISFGQPPGFAFRGNEQYFYSPFLEEAVRYDSPLCRTRHYPPDDR